MWNCDSGVEVKRALQGLREMLSVCQWLYGRVQARKTVKLTKKES